jgi:hypothetical protein
MFALKAFISYMSSLIEHPRDPPRKSLDSLPTELLLMISAYLHKNDAICFLLCTRRFYTLFGFRGRLLQMPRTQENRLLLLYRLGRDLPDRFTCNVCILHHKYDDSKDYRIPAISNTHPHPHPLFCVHKWKWNSTDLEMCLHNHRHTQCKFLFLHLQLAMRTVYYGPQQGISTDSLAYVEVKKHIESTTLFSIDAKICPELPCICLRIQDIMAVKRVGAHKLVPNDKNIRKKTDPLFAFRICPHLSNLRAERLIKPLVDLYYLDQQPAPYFKGCSSCKTDYEVELCEFGANDLALVNTRWVNLGPGISPTDRRWNFHAYDPRTSLAPKLRAWEVFETLDFRSPRLIFESLAIADGDPIVELRERNLRSLCETRYNTSGNSGDALQ